MTWSSFITTVRSDASAAVHTAQARPTGVCVASFRKFVSYVLQECMCTRGWPPYVLGGLIAYALSPYHLLGCCTTF